MVAALPTLEHQVAQFVEAMRLANSQLTETDAQKPAPPDLPADTPGPDDLTATLHRAFAAQDALAAHQRKREVYEAMRNEWLRWGRERMKTLEEWMGRKDLPVVERVRIIGLADRLAWYGVEGNLKG